VPEARQLSGRCPGMSNGITVGQEAAGVNLFAVISA
jgi:hypothetical protein